MFFPIRLRRPVAKHLFTLLATVLSFLGSPVARASESLLAEPPLVVEPTSAFTTRVIWSMNVLVGTPEETEGTEWRTRLLFVKEGTSDRAILEFDLRSLPRARSVSLDFRMAHFNLQDFLQVSLYSFEANGLANAVDYFRTDEFLTTFADKGDLGLFHSYSLDVTGAYNRAIDNGYSYLGFLLKNTPIARHDLGNGSTSIPFPTLVITIPEPASELLIFIGASMVSLRRRSHAHQRRCGS